MCQWKPFIFLAFGQSCLQAVLSHCVKHSVFQCQTILLTVFLALNKKHWVSTGVTGLILCFPTAKQNCYCYCERKPEAFSDSYILVNGRATNSPVLPEVAPCGKWIFWPKHSQIKLTLNFVNCFWWSQGQYEYAVLLHDIFFLVVGCNFVL